MTVSSRSIGVHFLDEQTLANLSRIMFAQKSASANAAEALLKNNTKETPVSFEKILSTISIHFFCHFRREFVAYSIQITCGNSWSFGNCFCLYSRSSSFWRTYLHYSKTISIDNRKWGSRNNTYWLLFFCFSSRSTPVSGVCWLFSVLHANLSVWVWISYFLFSYNYCWEEIVSLKCPDCSTVACTGGIFLGNQILW